MLSAGAASSAGYSRCIWRLSRWSGASNCRRPSGLYCSGGRLQRWLWPGAPRPALTAATHLANARRRLHAKANHALEANNTLQGLDTKNGLGNLKTLEALLDHEALLGLGTNNRRRGLAGAAPAAAAAEARPSKSQYLNYNGWRPL